MGGVRLEERSYSDLTSHASDYDIVRTEQYLNLVERWLYATTNNKQGIVDAKGWIERPDSKGFLLVRLPSTSKVVLKLLDPLNVWWSSLIGATAASSSRDIVLLYRERQSLNFLR